MHRMCTYILVMMGWEGVGSGCTVPPLRTVAYKNRKVWMQLSGPLRGDWKTRPAAQRPRWTAYSQALVQCKQPINHVQVWAVHTYMAMHKRVLYTSHLRRKIGGCLGDLGGGAYHPLVQYKQTITNVHASAVLIYTVMHERARYTSHPRQIATASHVHIHSDKASTGGD